MSDIRDTYLRAVDLLSARDHSALELTHKLRRKGFAADQIDQVINRLVDEGYISEARFAENYLRSRALRGFGPIKIRVELSERGIGDEVTDALFAKLADDYWPQVLATLWHKKLARRFDGSVNAKVKCVRYLHQKGFPSHDIFQFIDEQSRLNDE